MRAKEFDEAPPPGALAEPDAPGDLSYRRRGLTRTLCTGVTVPFAALMIVMLVIAVLALRSEVDRLAGETAQRALASARDSLQNEISGSTVGFLRAKAESARDLLAAFDDRAARGEMTKAQAYAAARRILSDPRFGRLGAAGYYAAVDDRGFWTLHPPAGADDAAKLGLVQEARTMGDGYMEFQWQDAGDRSPREKAAYVTRYAPRDLLVWAVVDEAEFVGHLDPGRLEGWIRPLGAKESNPYFLLDATGKVVLGRDAFGVAPLGGALRSRSNGRERPRDRDRHSGHEVRRDRRRAPARRRESPERRALGIGFGDPTRSL